MAELCKPTPPLDAEAWDRLIKLTNKPLPDATIKRFEEAGLFRSTFLCTPVELKSVPSLRAGVIAQIESGDIVFS